eukprot:1937034-Amphidinium_carterae.1
MLVTSLVWQGYGSNASGLGVVHDDRGDSDFCHPRLAHPCCRRQSLSAPPVAPPQYEQPCGVVGPPLVR